MNFATIIIPNLTVSMTGIITSPNFPGEYPYNLQKSETIKGEDGKILLLEFADFDVFALRELDESTGLTADTVHNDDPCPYDFVQVTDGDGTMLMNKSCGNMKSNRSDPNFFVPPNITSNTNLVNVFFSTDGTGAKTGWALNWRSVLSGTTYMIL